MGRHDTALELFEKALAISKGVDGDKQHPHIASTYDNMAHSCVQQGKHAKALEHYTTCLAMKSAALGPAHPDLAAAHGNIASVHVLTGNGAKALEHFEKELAINLATTRGEMDPTTAVCYNNMGSLHEDTGNTAKAKDLYGKAVGIAMATLGEGHPLSALMAANLKRVS